MDQTPSPSPSIQGEGATSCPEPPWTGWIETTGDALLILEAARRGIIPRVTRRLVDSERKMISSGSVFVFDEDESGIKRWTDGFYWSPSRILGNFLVCTPERIFGVLYRNLRLGLFMYPYVSVCSRFIEKLIRRLICVDPNGLKLQQAMCLLFSLMKVAQPSGMNPPRCPVRRARKPPT